MKDAVIMLQNETNSNSPPDSYRDKQGLGGSILYSKSDIKLMRAAEDSLLMGENRVKELKLFANNLGISRIVIAH